MNKKINFKIFSIIALLLIVLVLCLFGLKSTVCLTLNNDFYKFIRTISLIIFIMLLIITLCLHVIIVYKNFNSSIFWEKIVEINNNLKIEIKNKNFFWQFLLFG